jgi:hypothetical protein
MSRLLLRALRRELTALVAVLAAMTLSVGLASGSATGFESSAAPAQANRPDADQPPCESPGRSGSSNPRCDDREEPVGQEPAEEEPGEEEPAEEGPREEGSCASGGAGDGATLAEQLGGPGLHEDGPVSGSLHEQAEPEGGEAGVGFHELACGAAALEARIPGEETGEPGGKEPGEPGGKEPGEGDTPDVGPGEDEPGEEEPGEPGEEEPVEKDGCTTAPGEDNPVTGAVREVACAVTPLEVRVPAGVTIR